MTGTICRTTTPSARRTWASRTTTRSSASFRASTRPVPSVDFRSSRLASFATTGAGQFIQDQLVFQNTYHFIDSVSWTHGKHLIKFGGEFHHTLYRGYGAPNYLDGQVVFNGGLTPNFPGATPLEDFLSGSPSSGQFLLNPVQTTTRFNRFAGFFQDDWRITKRLTLNLGLRYEYEPPASGRAQRLRQLRSQYALGHGAAERGQGAL